MLYNPYQTVAYLPRRLKPSSRYNCNPITCPVVQEAIPPATLSESIILLPNAQLSACECDGTNDLIPIFPVIYPPARSNNNGNNDGNLVSLHLSHNTLLLQFRHNVYTFASIFDQDTCALPCIQKPLYLNMHMTHHSYITQSCLPTAMQPTQPVAIFPLTYQT